MLLRSRNLTTSSKYARVRLRLKGLVLSKLNCDVISQLNSIETLCLIQESKVLYLRNNITVSNNAQLSIVSFSICGTVTATAETLFPTRSCVP